MTFDKTDSHPESNLANKNWNSRLDASENKNQQIKKKPHFFLRAIEKGHLKLLHSDVHLLTKLFKVQLQKHIFDA